MEGGFAIMPRKISLKVKLILTCLCLAVVPAVVVGAFGFMQLRSFSNVAVSQSFNVLEKQGQDTLLNGVLADREKVKRL